MNPIFDIKQADKSDTSEIAEFLNKAEYVHKHLDWQGILDWIPFPPFLILKGEGKLLGLLACPPNMEKVVWIRCFACLNSSSLSYVWISLFQHVCQLPELSGTSMYSVGVNDWFAEILEDAGFDHFQNIVVLIWNRRQPEIQIPPLPCVIRPMEVNDLLAVAELDHIAFESMWVNPLDKITLAYYQSEHAYVAEINDEIVGYEMTTANHFSAHLARIAVHPKYQKQHIASTLIVEMIKYFKRKGIDQITVNTQDNNNSSLALYKSLGFQLTGEAFPVFRYLLK